MYGITERLRRLFKKPEVKIIPTTSEDSWGYKKMYWFDPSESGKDLCWPGEGELFFIWRYLP
jgi:hypothetical protein